MASSLPESAGAGIRLGLELAQYRLLCHADLPQEWREPIEGSFLQQMAQRLQVADVTAFICIELPDYPWAWHYFRWWQRESELARHRGERPLSLMVVSQADYFRDLPTAAERRQLARQCLRSLQEEGIPPLLLSRSFGTRPLTEPNRWYEVGG